MRSALSARQRPSGVSLEPREPRSLRSVTSAGRVRRAETHSGARFRQTGGSNPELEKKKTTKENSYEAK